MPRGAWWRAIVLGSCALALGSPSAAAARKKSSATHAKSKQSVTVGGGAKSKPPATGVAPPSKGPRAGSDGDVARLGRGYERYRANDYAAARKELAPLAEAPLLDRDYALYLLAQSESLDGESERALQHFQQLAAMQQKNALPSRFAALARARAADMSYALERWAAAKQGYQAVLAARAPEVEPSVARFRLAEIAARSGDTKGAIAGFREVFVEHPEHPLADRALERMKALQPGVDGTKLVEPRERVERAKRLTAERQWQRALDELALVPADAPPAVRLEADYWIGMTHYNMRHGYDVAAEKLLTVAEKLDASRRTAALYHGARAWSRADQDDKAIAAYRDLLARFPHAKEANDAAFRIGWLEFNRGRYKEALAPLETALAKYGGFRADEDPRWYHGFSSWLLGDAEHALADFETVARRGGSLDGGNGRYWKGRALEKLGRTGEAVATWRALVGEWPLTYYAQLARLRLAEHKVEVGPFGDVKQPPSTTPVGPVDERYARDPAIARVDELVRAGLDVEAGFELDRADGPLLQKYGATRLLPLLFDRYVKASNWHRPHVLAESYGSAALRDDPQLTDGAKSWWELMYPLAYRPLVEKFGPTGMNPTYYLYTIMQKESAYNPHDVSYADAIGLLQMIPPTSRRVGDKIGRPYTDDVLYDPEGNIQFGAWYIGHLLAKFKGQVALGAGSFNAGPQAMMRWIKKNGARPLDEFVELCPYTQTREYMKKALDIYAHYLYLYEKQAYLPDMHVDASWLDDGIDY